MAQEVCRTDTVGGAPPEAARGRECTSEEDGGRLVAGQGHAAGCYPSKALRPAKGRELVDDLRGVWQVSIRRACSVLMFGRSTYHYKSRRPSQAGLRKRIREIAETHVRYGYPRIHVFLEREGWQVNRKRTYRLYIEEDLQIRNK